MRVAFLTAGGIAPCLSASIGYLIQFYNDIRNDISFVGYLNGYKGLLTGNSINFPNEIKDNALELLNYGGSPIGNSRVKLTNIADCVSKGYVKDGDITSVNPDLLEKPEILERIVESSWDGLGMGPFITSPKGKTD